MGLARPIATHVALPLGIEVSPLVGFPHAPPSKALARTGVDGKPAIWGFELLLIYQKIVYYPLVKIYFIRIDKNENCGIGRLY